MPQSLTAKIVLLEAFIAYCYDVYISINKMPITTHVTNPLNSSSTQILDGLLCVLFLRVLMYGFLLILSKPNGIANLLLVIGSTFITAIGIFIESDTTSNGWQFMSIPIQFAIVLILWPVVYLTQHSTVPPTSVS